ncbi:sensor histidine kinase [Agrobacterium sp. rho-13.3]|uniref:sensor histidine kinase n=1 Tax=Agrobacterium sp. rho-13.3 TaxID=3072980 RepID=UPI002A14AE36|nr:HAMP domain-containing sensor histidine kinase [Agrobacterium sp. rho-13.3]MDX8308106.1 HAMP domain-containing sensor histidine kinase [Agrobacterium sp. rho-13.3]
MTLSQRLLLRILPTIIVTITVIGLLAYHSARREIDNIYDAQLINDANVLWSLLKRPLSSPQRPEIHVPDLDFNMNNQLAINEDADDYADAHAYRAWRGSTLALESSKAFPASLKQLKAGFTDLHFQGELWRVYSLPIFGQDVTIEIAENIQLRQTLVGNILTNLSLPLLVLIPAIAFITWLAINSGLRSIRHLVKQIRTRNPDDLARISSGGLPRDLAPLVQSLNVLLHKLERSITLERQFSDLAAHQLRTPQAGIKLLLQLLERCDSEDERKALMMDLVASNERAMHLIEQLLRLARVGHQPLKLEPVNLTNLATACVAGFGQALAGRDVQMDLIENVEASVMTDRAALGVMIDNVIDNAIKYSPAGTRIAVTLAQAENGWRLCISDSGSGISPEQHPHAFQRFNRLDADDSAGAGLGLTIVADIANRLGIRILLDTPEWGYGLRVGFEIPAA